jgi:hypothetical protein
LDKHRSVGDYIQSLFGYNHGTAMEIVNYTALGASDDYYYENYGSMAFTFEGQYRTEKTKIQKHVTMWNKLLSDVADKDGVVEDSGTPQASNRLFVMLQSYNGNSNQAMIYASAGQLASSVEYCLGNRTTCALSSSSRVRLNVFSSVGDRKVFKTQSAMNISNNLEMTFFSGATPQAQTSIRIVAK